MLCRLFRHVVLIIYDTFLRRYYLFSSLFCGLTAHSPAPTPTARSSINMAATFAFSRARVFGRARVLNQFSNYHSSFTSISKKQSNAAFLLGFGLAGFVGFSGILYGKKQKKGIAVGKDSLGVEENCSLQSVSVSSYYQVKFRTWRNDEQIVDKYTSFF